MPSIFTKYKKYNYFKKKNYRYFLKNYRSYSGLNNLKIKKKKTKNLIFLKAF